MINQQLLQGYHVAPVPSGAYLTEFNGTKNAPGWQTIYTVPAKNQSYIVHVGLSFNGAGAGQLQVEHTSAGAFHYHWLFNYYKNALDDGFDQIFYFKCPLMATGDIIRIQPTAINMNLIVWGEVAEMQILP
jgi:hypothetical protein